MKGRASTKKKSMEKQSIPIFDLQNFPGKYENMLREACEEWGCFRVVNHSIPISLMSDMKEVVKSLLDLPIEIKKRNTDTLFASGYAAKKETSPLYESLGLYNIGTSQAVQDFCTKLDVSVHRRSVIEAYGQAVTGLAMKISEKLVASLGLNGYSLEGWPMHCRMNKYSFTPETIGCFGVHMHTDPVFFTLLQDDEKVGGLEVMNKSGKYVCVDPLPGSILVNFGDIGTAWSNGRFYNVKHRVQCKEASTRLSIASFVLGPKEGTVEAPSEFVDDQHPRLYVPFNWEDYRKLRLANFFRNIDGLSDVRLIH